MPRFFVEPGQIRDGYIYLTGQDAVHITRVLRLGRGDRILVLDGRGKSYQAVIEDAGRTRVICAVTGEIPVFSSPGPRLTLVQGLPKGDKMDLIVEKSTELGISRIIPLVCERTVLKLEGDKLSRRRERWIRIAREASKQCRRPDVPEVDLPGGWDQALRDLDRATALIPWEEENVLTLKSFLRENTNPGSRFMFLSARKGGLPPVRWSGPVPTVSGRLRWGRASFEQKLPVWL
jgi:16S rRNA (uracil1498-N3)-methyltransferase